MLEVEQKTESEKGEEREDKEKKDKDHQKKNAKKDSSGKPQKSDTSEENGCISVKGLSNLGNTCFFNAVIQVRLCFMACQSSVNVLNSIINKC